MSDGLIDFGESGIKKTLMHSCVLLTWSNQGGWTL